MSYDGLLVNTCDLIKETKDAYGRKTGEAVTAGEKCRWMWGLRRVEITEGVVIMSIAKVFFRKTVVIDTEYFLGYGGKRFKVIKILKPQNSAVMHHVEVYVN